MSSNTYIKQAFINDLPEILKIEQACFHDDSFSKRQLAYLISRAKGICYAALVADKVVGYISVIYRNRSHNARIYSVAVLPEFQGKGIGKMLLDSCATFAFQHHLSKITLEVNVHNTSAQKFYQNYGFVATGSIPCYYHDGSDAFRMMKIIAEY